MGYILGQTSWEILLFSLKLFASEMHVAPRIFPSSGLLVYTKRAHLLLLIFTGRCYIILLGQPERFTSKRQLRTTSPVNTNSSADETDPEIKSVFNLNDNISHYGTNF